MYDLADPDPAALGAPIFKSYIPMWTGVISDDGASVFFSNLNGEMLVYNTSVLLVSPNPMQERLTPRGSRIQIGRPIFGGAFSKDRGRIFAATMDGILVLGASDASLVELRVLPFKPAEGNQMSFSNHCKCAGGLLAANGGGSGAMIGGSVSPLDAKSKTVRVWRVDDDNEVEIRTLVFLAPADSVALSVDGGADRCGHSRWCSPHHFDEQLDDASDFGACSYGEQRQHDLVVGV
eukprot:SAG31_NODE_786_length_12098_cov_15.117446_6_plen_235_part_00